MARHGTARTSIGLGGGEVILVAEELDAVRDEITLGLRDEVTMVEFTDVRDGELKIINPFQVKVIQPITESLARPPQVNMGLGAVP
jgi:hypothetical protein